MKHDLIDAIDGSGQINWDDLGAGSKRSVFETAVARNNADLIRFLANNHGININEQVPNEAGVFIHAIGQTQLFTAIASQSKESAKALRELGIDVNIRDGKGNTAMHSLVGFLEYITRPDNPNKGSYRIADLVDIAKTLTEGENAADLTITNADGKTPIDLIESQQVKQILRDVPAISAILVKGGREVQ